VQHHGRVRTGLRHRRRGRAAEVNSPPHQLVVEWRQRLGEWGKKVRVTDFRRSRLFLSNCVF
jgi:hypothetical protein